MQGFCELLAENDSEALDCLESLYDQTPVETTIFNVLVVTVILGVFRLYFLNVMKEYKREHGHHYN